MDSNVTNSASGYPVGYDGGFYPISEFGELNCHRLVVLDYVWVT